MLRSLRPLLVLLPAFAGCSEPGAPLDGPAPRSYDAHPETPALLRDVAMLDDDAEWNNPYIPGLRTTQDGRVGLRVQGGPTTLSFYLQVPEAVDSPIMTGPSGLRLIENGEPIVLELPPAQNPELQRVGHHAICDPTEEFAVPGERPNPYACGEGDAHDCYDITIISSVSEGFEITMWGTPATVEVASPKTADARIEHIELGESIRGGTQPLSLEWAEVNVTLDGRLLTGRWGGFLREWTHPETGEIIQRQYDLGYSVLPPESDPCDVTGWTEFHPVSHAPYDPMMQGRYGLAAYPFRDSEGNPIGDGEDMGGSYPWTDREGANVFMTAVPGIITEQPEDDFPRRCVVAGCESDEYTPDFDRGFHIAGLWTHGKLVHLDSVINNQDWSVGVRPESHLFVDLYRDADGAPVPVRFGAGRGFDINVPGYPGNANILDSLQHMLNFNPAIRPITPRDVVWVMSSGVATDEVVFDDFLDPRAFIVSNMQASVTQLVEADGTTTTGIPIHWNGQQREVTGFHVVSNLTPYELVDGPADVHIQNAATSLAFAVPSYGLVEAGTGRAEPVALGGFYGRGFWLDGDNRITYEVPAESAEIGGDWYIGLFVDPRTDEGATRALLTFPDGTSVRLVDRETLQYVRNERVLHQVALPVADEGWLHLGWNVRRENRELTLLVDGFAFDRFTPSRAFFTLTEGALVVGRAADRSGDVRDAGVRGWVDDFKVLAHDIDPEVACNHAGGTLIAVGSNAQWAALAETFPEWAHDEVAASAARGAGARYACLHDYSDDYAATLANLPEGAEGLRDTILFPEGPLQHGVPRPDSSENAFCLSCHTDEGIAGMNTAALAFRPGVAAEHDRRRQPLQPPRRVFGNVPANWIPAGEGSGSPSEAFIAPAEGALIDRWVMPAGE